MKFAYWGLVALAVVLVIFGYVNSIHWLAFVAVGFLLVAAALNPNPKRRLFGLRRNS